MKYTITLTLHVSASHDSEADEPEEALQAVKDGLDRLLGRTFPSGDFGGYGALATYETPTVIVTKEETE